MLDYWVLADGPHFLYGSEHTCSLDALSLDGEGEILAK